MGVWRCAWCKICNDIIYFVWLLLRRQRRSSCIMGNCSWRRQQKGGSACCILFSVLLVSCAVCRHREEQPPQRMSATRAAAAVAACCGMWPYLRLVVHLPAFGGTHAAWEHALTQCDCHFESCRSFWRLPDTCYVWEFS